MESRAGYDDLRHTAFRLRDGAGFMPALGFGTLIPDAGATRKAVEVALRAGFRQFDCAERYRNEASVGEALAAAVADGVVERGDIFVTTKLWNNNHRPERVRPAFEASLARLRLDHADLYLVHTPFAFPPGEEQDPRDADGKVIYDDGVSMLDTWHAMESLVEAGRCRAIGLSDVDRPILEQILSAARIKPAVVQVESHPYLPEWELLEFCRRNDIVVHAFAALGHAMHPPLLQDPIIVAIAERVGKTPAQTVLAWALQRGTAPLTTSKTPSRIIENVNVSALPEDAIHEINTKITTRFRFNQVVKTGIPGFIPGGR